VREITAPLNGKQNFCCVPDQTPTPDWTWASPAAQAMYASITAAVMADDLDRLASLVWRYTGNGFITQDEAEVMDARIRDRRFILRAPARYSMGRQGGRLGRRFLPRPCRRRLSNEERTKRRRLKRMLGGSSSMPGPMARDFTEGERAVLCVVAGEVKHHGVCDLTMDEIADRAGVRPTTARNALHEARRLRHLQIVQRPRPGAKNLPNLIKIVSAEWLAWIKRAPNAARGIASNFGNVNALNNIDEEKNEKRLTNKGIGAATTGDLAHNAQLGAVTTSRTLL
jgi:hypothetical protein